MAADLATIVAGLVSFNASRTEREDRRTVAVLCRQAGRIVGGANGYTHWGWLSVSHLWVDDARRGQGVGRRLMASMEDEARCRGCRAALVDTFSFQAPGFYRAIGYRQFGELVDFPPGHIRHFFCKELEPSRG